MRKFGIASLILLVAGTVAIWIETSNSSPYEGEAFYGKLLIGVAIIIGITILSIIKISPKKPVLAGVIAIMLSSFGILLWAIALILIIINHNFRDIPHRFLFFTSAIALFIGGILSFREGLQEKAAIEPKQENAPE
ncbi:MAG: hypothetical protein HXX08_22620 [Chloroflexi bacterium]|uniref:Uncharacterized protein n=1 Tax=Candidatus Chlorohelix allophototropha TaxID=3003348 RepID=A0A8T7M9C5_9CHLR|nr:hypothetical protein [Chloroflexota bacterium]WJW68594.1 hypothetical protein OZ401_004208 [Chloroflexota bacterium L227-S17]